MMLSAISHLPTATYRLIRPSAHSAQSASLLLSPGIKDVSSRSSKWALSLQASGRLPSINRAPVLLSNGISRATPSNQVQRLLNTTPPPSGHDSDDASLFEEPFPKARNGSAWATPLFVYKSEEEMTKNIRGLQERYPGLEYYFEEAGQHFAKLRQQATSLSLEQFDHEFIRFEQAYFDRFKEGGGGEERAHMTYCLTNMCLSQGHRKMALLMWLVEGKKE